MIEADGWETVHATGERLRVASAGLVISVRYAPVWGGIPPKIMGSRMLAAEIDRTADPGPWCSITAPPPGCAVVGFYGGTHCIFCDRPREEHGDNLNPLQRMADDLRSK